MKKGANCKAEQTAQIHLLSSRVDPVIPLFISFVPLSHEYLPHAYHACARVTLLVDRTGRKKIRMVKTSAFLC